MKHDFEQCQESISPSRLRASWFSDTRRCITRRDHAKNSKSIDDCGANEEAQHDEDQQGRLMSIIYNTRSPLYEFTHLEFNQTSNKFMTTQKFSAGSSKVIAFASLGMFWNAKKPYWERSNTTAEQLSCSKASDDNDARIQSDAFE